MANAARRSAERFHGKNGWMSSGALPPAAAQLSKYHVSHNRGLRFQWASVAISENMAAARATVTRRKSGLLSIWRKPASMSAYRCAACAWQEGLEDR